MSIWLQTGCFRTNWDAQLRSSSRTDQSRVGSYVALVADSDATHAREESKLELAGCRDLGETFWLAWCMQRLHQLAS